MEEENNYTGSTQLLVSIIVITYNSSKYVLETLESAKAQTYRNIELIISDDASTDNTVEICRKWVGENKERFVRTEIITVQENTGIPANCNRGAKAAQGEWVKLIAGDDALIETAIFNYLEFISENPEVKLFFAFSERFRDSFSENCFMKRFPAKHPLKFTEKNITAEMQYIMLLISNQVNAPTVIFKKEIIDEVGGFDEQFRLFEDHPMWLKLTKAGYKIHFMPETTVKHRLHINATDSFISNQLHKPGYFRNEEFRRAYIYPNISKSQKKNEQYKFQIRCLLNFLGLNKNKTWAKNIDLFLIKYLNPFAWYCYISKKNSVKSI